MADYYVSKDGDDSTGDGLSWATAWKTIGKAASVIGDSSPGDVVYISSGRYIANNLWAGHNYTPRLVGVGHVIIDGDGGMVFTPNRGVQPTGEVGCYNLTFVNLQYVMYGSTVYDEGVFEDCQFWGGAPTRGARGGGQFTRCLFHNCSTAGNSYWEYGEANAYKAERFFRCSFVNTRLKADTASYVDSITNCIFHNPSLVGEYFDFNSAREIRNNCFSVIDVDRTINGESSIAGLEVAYPVAVDNFVLSTPFKDDSADVFYPVNDSRLAMGAYGLSLGALPYAHVLSPNVNSAAFAAPDHTDNVEQDGDVWKLTSSGAGVLSWYQDLGNTYNVTGLDVIGTITDAGHVWDTDNSDSDLTYLIKGSASPFTPVTSTPTAGVDGWLLANHGESISLASVRYVQVWIVPRTNGVT